MKLETSGFLIGIKNLSEKDLIGTFFTQNYGILSGVLKAGQISKTKYQPGMLGSISWNARLENHLGVIHFENQKNLSAKIMMDSRKLICLNSLFSMLINSLPERQDQGFLYNETLATILKIEHKNPIYEYSLWEIKLLSALGYSLDFSKCGNCSKNSNLTYISPKTGHCICDICGENYKDKLFKIPNSLRDYIQNPSKSEIIDIIKISSNFFNKIEFFNDSFKISQARDEFIKLLNKQD